MDTFNAEAAELADLPLHFGEINVFLELFFFLNTNDFAGC